MFAENSSKNPYHQFVSAPCGSGKTYSACQYIKKQKGLCLYVAQTIILLKQTREMLIEIGMDQNDIRLITGETNPNDVKATIIDHLKTAGHGRESILLITWSSYSTLPYYPKRKDWEIIIDEIPAPDNYFPFRLPYNNKFLLERIVLGETINGSIAKVKPKNKSSLKHFIERDVDVVDENFKPLFREIISPNKDVFVDLKSWNNINNQDKEEPDNAVYFMSILNAELFKGATVMGANFDNSLLYNWLIRYHDVQFMPNVDIVSGLRFDRHSDSMSKRLYIYYLFRKRAFSKTLRDSKCGDGESALDRIEEAVNNEPFIDDEPFLFVANNDYKGELSNHRHAIAIKVISHGLNEYQNINNMVFLAALNREPHHLGLLKSLGFDSHQVRKSTTYEVLYQSIMRTSLRDPKSTSPVHIIVPDKFSSDYLVDIFDGGYVKASGDIDFDYRIPLSRVQRKDRSNFNKIKQEILSPGNMDVGDVELSLTSGSTKQHKSPDLIERARIGNDSCKNIADKVTKTGHELYMGGHSKSSIISPKSHLIVTYHKHIKNYRANDFIQKRYDSPLAFAKQMKALSRTIIDSKDKLFLICAGTFNPTDGYKTKANFIQSNMIILDFDNGDISHQQFEDIFWNKAGRGQRLSFITCNSFSRSPEQTNRFRAMIFFKKPAVSTAEIEAVYNLIVERIVAEGFPEDKIGLDTQCKSGVQSFYVPSTNREYPEYGFFNKFGMKRTSDIERYGMNPGTIYRTRLTETNPATTISYSKRKVNDEINQNMIDNSKSKLMSMTENRRAPFFNFSVMMKKMGMEQIEVREQLLEVAGNDRKMIKWTADCLKTLYG